MHLNQILTAAYKSKLCNWYTDVLIDMWGEVDVGSWRKSILWLIWVWLRFGVSGGDLL